MDESKKPLRNRATGRVANLGAFYVVAGAVVFEGEIEDHRSRIRKLETELGFSLHYNDLSRTRRRDAIEAIASLEGWEAHLFESSQPDHNPARASINSTSRTTGWSKN